MKVQVNNKEVELTTGNTISALAAQLDLPPQGVAIALNNRMIPRSQWAEQEIQNGDGIGIIRAAFGGERNGTGIHDTVYRVRLLL